MDLTGCRYRIRDGIQPTYFSTDYYDHYYSGGQWIAKPVNHQEGLVSGTGEKKQIWDDVHHNYAERRRNGEIIMGRLQISTETRSASNTVFTFGPYYHSNPTLWPHGYKEEHDFDADGLLNDVAPPLTFDARSDAGSLGSIALQKAYAKMNESELMSGELIHSLDQTVSMLRRPLGGSRDLVKRMLKARDRHLGKTTSSLIQANANAWLEYRYGWKPLMMDAKTIMAQAGNIRSRPERKLLVVRASEENEFNQTHFFTDKALSWTSNWRLSGSVRYETKCRASAGVIYNVKSMTAYQSMNQILGLRSSDFGPTFWETIPYSFVVDWFVGVGTWLRAITPVPGIEVRGSWLTTVKDYRKTFPGGTLKVSGLPLSTTETRSYQGYDYSLNTVTRDANPSLTTTPVLSVKPLNVLQSVDGVSLLATNILSDLRSMRPSYRR